MDYTITRNPDFNSLEISFCGKPPAAVREALKSLKFRWNGKKKVWYGFADESAVRRTIDGAETEEPAADEKPVKKADKPSESENQYGVKVGDLFYMDWGYDQTNIDFFQVSALCGKTSVIVRQVSPERVQMDGVSCMSAYCTYKLPEGLLPPNSRSVFIDDNAKGKLCRVKPGYGGGLRIRITDDHDASPYHGQKVYESWYA